MLRYFNAFLIALPLIVFSGDVFALPRTSTRMGVIRLGPTEAQSQDMARRCHDDYENAEQHLADLRAQCNQGDCRGLCCGLMGHVRPDGGCALFSDYTYDQFYNCVYQAETYPNYRDSLQSTIHDRNLIAYLQCTDGIYE